ncbi:MAG: hypothetical protein ACTHMZ_07180 [Actinomycetes bacterium]
MPRSNRPRSGGRPRRGAGGPGGRGGQGDGEQPRELRVGGMRRYVEASDGEWIVQPVTGQDASKSYRCPGCSQEIRARTPHVVAWRADGTSFGSDGLETRRHWHRACFDRRAHRR